MAWSPVESAAHLVGKHETLTFDWKATYDFADPTTAFEVAKDVAAFASAVGGTILIGAHEGGGPRRGMVGAFASVTAPGELVTRVTQSVNQNTRPLPIFEPRIIRLSVDDQRQVLEREPDETAEVIVVAVNVRPTASGFVAVRVCRPDGAVIADAFKFPIRGGERTRCLLPEELALYQDAHERKVAVLLHQIPAVDRAQGAGLRVRLYDDTGATNQLRDVVRIDEEHKILVLMLDGLHETLTANIPFAFIRTVWRDELGEWCIFVEGRVFHDIADASRPQFIPTRR